LSPWWSSLNIWIWCRGYSVLDIRLCGIISQKIKMICCSGCGKCPKFHTLSSSCWLVTAKKLTMKITVTRVEYFSKICLLPCTISRPCTDWC
jgi:hypothetical protein